MLLQTQIIRNLLQLKKRGTKQQKHYIVGGDKRLRLWGRTLGLKFSKRIIWQLKSPSDITRLPRIFLLFSCLQEKQHHTVSYIIKFLNIILWVPLISPELSKKNTTERIVNKVFILKEFTVHSSRENRN